ncbi:MAG: hypothetical protein GQ574_25960 [Crocinitomix sp.]|nr:hypothetical protein [Crocinitomix sp.]
MSEIKSHVDFINIDEDLESLETDEVLERFKESAAFIKKVISRQIDPSNKVFDFHNNRLERSCEILKERRVDLSPYFPTKRKKEAADRNAKDGAVTGIVLSIIVVIAGVIMMGFDNAKDFAMIPIVVGVIILIIALSIYRKASNPEPFESRDYSKKDNESSSKT